MSVVTYPGLSDQEAQTRRRQGQGNDAAIKTGRSYAEIVRQNVVNLINVILFTIGVIMVLIGRPSEAFISVGLISLNAVVGIYQEARAKRQLDKISLLTRPKVTVRRDGTQKSVDPSELVLGDIIVSEPGDQILVDGIVREGKIEVDESLLTGESDLIPKVDGAEVLSGSFVVTGKAIYEATKVGVDSFANKLTASAKQFRIQKTPLQKDVDVVVRFLMLLALLIGFMIGMASIVSALPFMRTVQMAAVVAGLVPNGLFFMVIVSYAMGAVRIVNQGALIQQANSVESLSNVNVLCMDKTGTLTANRIHYQDVYPLGLEKDLVMRMLGDFARSGSSGNRTSEAVVEGVPGQARKPIDEVPFSSALKWSAVAFDDPQMYGVYVMGALEMLQSSLKGADLSARVQEWSDQGLRVLIFAYNPQTTKLHDSLGNPGLPELTPLGIVVFGDELRPHLQETMQGFIAAGVSLKVISGDNPQTVAALAKQAGFPGDLTAVSGPDLDKLSDDEFDKMAARATIFGRITPQQKERLVDSLCRQNNYVAMIGDGVNDVLSLKKANLGIAMQSGSAATRGVADMVLLNDSFQALPPAFLEGQRILNGMQDVLKLFLARALAQAMLIFALAVIGQWFPYLPKHTSLLTFVTVGIPTFALAVWAKPGKLIKSSLIKSLAHFVFPVALITLVFGVLVYTGAVLFSLNGLNVESVTQAEISQFREFAGIQYDLDAPDFVRERAVLTAQSALVTFTVFIGLALVIFVEPPTRWWVAGDLYSGDWRPTILSGILLLIYLAIISYTPVRRFFELLPLPLGINMFLLVLAGVWTMLLRAVWRGRWLERFLGIEPLRPEIDFSNAAPKKETIVMAQVRSMTQAVKSVKI